MTKDPEQEVRAASVRVAIARAAVTALDEALRGPRLQRKAALATYHQRLAEHSAALLARPQRGEGEAT
jgi:hypothetical protein